MIFQFSYAESFWTQCSCIIKHDTNTRKQPCVWTPCLESWSDVFFPPQKCSINELKIAKNYINISHNEISSTCENAICPFKSWTTGQKMSPTSLKKVWVVCVLQFFCFPHPHVIILTVLVAQWSHIPVILCHSNPGFKLLPRIISTLFVWLPLCCCKCDHAQGVFSKSITPLNVTPWTSSVRIKKS